MGELVVEKITYADVINETSEQVSEVFSGYSDLIKNTLYQAKTDGFVIVYTKMRHDFRRIDYKLWSNEDKTKVTLFSDEAFIVKEYRDGSSQTSMYAIPKGHYFYNYLHWDGHLSKHHVKWIGMGNVKPKIVKN